MDTLEIILVLQIFIFVNMIFLKKYVKKEVKTIKEHIYYMESEINKVYKTEPKFKDPEYEKNMRSAKELDEITRCLSLFNKKDRTEEEEKEYLELKEKIDKRLAREKEEKKQETKEKIIRFVKVALVVLVVIILVKIIF